MIYLVSYNIVKILTVGLLYNVGNKVLQYFISYKWYYMNDRMNK